MVNKHNLGDNVNLGDGRTGKIEEISKYNLLWVRDAKGYLSSADSKTGWSSDGNWRNDIKPRS